MTAPSSLLGLQLLVALVVLVLSPSFARSSPSPLPLPSSRVSSSSPPLSAADPSRCVNEYECYPDVFAVWPNGTSEASGCWSCAQGGSCDSAWYGQAGLYCGRGTGQETIGGTVVQYQYVGFCCGVGEYGCTRGYSFTAQSDPDFRFEGYACTKPQRTISAVWLWLLGVLLIAVIAAATTTLYFLWKRRQAHENFMGYLGQPEPQPAQPQPEPIVSEQAALPSAPDLPAPEEPQGQAFRLDHSVTDPSAYQRMD